MAWALVIVAGLFETAFAVSLKLSDGFGRLWWTVSFLVCAAVSFTLLSIGLGSLPVGSAYAVWTGIGAVGTVVVGMLWFQEPATTIRMLLILTIVAAIAGLKLAA